MSPLDQAARELLTQNTQVGEYHGRRYTFSVPSRTAYRLQWFWDSCFHAIVWSRFDPSRAAEELRALVSHQAPDGLLAHMVYWNQPLIKRRLFTGPFSESRGRWWWLPWLPKPLTSALIQPPVIAQAVERVWQASGDERLLDEFVPKLIAYYEWLQKNRATADNPLLVIFSQFESGLDSSPAYDEVLKFTPGQRQPLSVHRFFRVDLYNKLRFDYNQRALLERGPFQVRDVLVNALYALNLDVLARLCQAAGKFEDYQRYSARSREVTTALLKDCWNESAGAFFNLNGRQQHCSQVLTVSSLMPLVLPRLPRPYVERLVAHLTNPQEFWLRYPIPSVAASEPTFHPDSRIPGRLRTNHWRGSTWMNTNWYLVHALRSHGYAELAETIAQKSRELVERHGFREYYNPHTGAPLAAHGFGWSTLVTDL